MKAISNSAITLLRCYDGVKPRRAIKILALAATWRQGSGSVLELKSSLVAGRLQKSAKSADVLLPNFKAENHVFEVT